MEILDACVLERAHRVDGDARGHQLAGLGILVEPAEQIGQSGRYAGPAQIAKAQQPLEVGNRQYAGHDGRPDPSRAHPLDETKIELGFEEELGDGPRRTGVELAFEVVEVEIGGRRFGMDLGIARDGDLEIGDAPQPGHQIDGIGVTLGVRRITIDAGRRVAPERDDMVDPGLPVSARDVIDLGTACADAGEVRGGFDRGLVADAADDGVGALARRAAGAVGHRHETGPQRRQTLDRMPQRIHHFLRLGWKEFERDARPAGLPGYARHG